MTALNDLTGRVFERLYVIERGPNTLSGKATWVCRCSCGANLTVRGGDLTSGNTKSCGCYAAEVWRETQKTHGGCGTRSWQVWRNMLDRCRRKGNLNYGRYGGRGIKVCQEWQSFENFFRDMGDAPIGCQLDRIDNDGDYEPPNCRWTTPTLNGRNKRNNVKYDLNGERLVRVELAQMSGLKQSTIRSRLLSGWTVEKAISTPPGRLWGRHL